MRQTKSFIQAMNLFSKKPFFFSSQQCHNFGYQGVNTKNEWVPWGLYSNRDSALKDMKLYITKLKGTYPEIYNEVYDCLISGNDEDYPQFSVKAIQRLWPDKVLPWLLWGPDDRRNEGTYPPTQMATYLNFAVKTLCELGRSEPVSLPNNPSLKN